MNELNIKCHYQMVKSVLPEGTEITVHEAYSTESGLYMVCPTPVLVAGETKEDIEELTSMIDKDIEQYGMLDLSEANIYFDKYVDYVHVDDVELSIDPYYEDEEVIEDDFYDGSGKVLDLVDFIKRNK